MNKRAWVVGTSIVGALLLSVGTASAQQSLTDKDRTEIQELSARYAKALGGCAAEDYADVFVPETGYFASNIRGEVVGPRAPDGAGAQRASLHQRRSAGRGGSAHRCRW